MGEHTLITVLNTRHVQNPAHAEPYRASVPGLAGDEDLAGVHHSAGQAGGVDGAQGGAQLDDVGPDQRLGQQARVLARRGRVRLTCWGHRKHRHPAATPTRPREIRVKEFSHSHREWKKWPSTGTQTIQTGECLL